MFSKIYKKSNKKGFTLTEMMIVIAIIVILAGAGLTGIIVSYNQYKKYAKDMEEHGGIQFEADARDVIENLFNGFGTYKPRTIKINDPDPQPAVSPTPGGGGGTPDPTSAPASPTSAPAGPTSGPPPTSAPAPTTPPAPTQGGGGGGGTNAPGSNTNINLGEINNFNGTVSFNSPLKKAIVSTNDPYFDINNWKYQCTPNGDGTYTIKYTGGYNSWDMPENSVIVRTHGHELTILSWS